MAGCCEKTSWSLWHGGDAVTFPCALCHPRCAVWLCFDCRTPGSCAKRGSVRHSVVWMALWISLCFCRGVFGIPSKLVKCSANNAAPVEHIVRWAGAVSNLVSKSSGAIDLCTQKAPLGPIYLHKEKPGSRSDQNFNDLGTFMLVTSNHFHRSSQHWWVGSEKLREEQKALSLGNYLHGAERFGFDA